MLNLLASCMNNNTLKVNVVGMIVSPIEGNNQNQRLARLVDNGVKSNNLPTMVNLVVVKEVNQHLTSRTLIKMTARFNVTETQTVKRLILAQNAESTNRMLPLNKQPNAMHA